MTVPTREYRSDTHSPSALSVCAYCWQVFTRVEN